MWQRFGFRSNSPGGEGGKGRGKFENAGWFEGFCYNRLCRASNFLPRLLSLSHAVMTSGLLTRGSREQPQLRTHRRGFKNEVLLKHFD